MNVHQARNLRIILLVYVTVISTTAAEGTRKNNLYSRWEPAINRFEEADRKTPQPRDGVLFAGSSSIRFWDLKKSFPKLEAINHGFGGSKIADTIHFADRIIWPFTPRVIIFYAGDNDIAGGKSAEETAKDFTNFSELLHKNLPDTQLIYIAIKPSIARWSLSDEMSKANSAIAEQCRQENNRSFLNIWTPMLGDNGLPNPDLFLKDGLHLNETGYKLWTKLTATELQKSAPTKSAGKSQNKFAAPAQRKLIFPLTNPLKNAMRCRGNETGTPNWRQWTLQLLRQPRREEQLGSFCEHKNRDR